MSYVWLDALEILFFIIFNPITWGIAAAVLIVNDKKRKKENKGQPGNPATRQPQRAPVQQKPENPMAKWNWLLYIGSFLVVLATVYFVDSVNDSFVAPLTISLTILIYIIGTIIHKRINYLRPVGKAFIYSALCMIPLWTISFSSLGMPDNITPLCVSMSLTVAALVGAFTTADSVMAYITYLCVDPLFWSICPALKLKGSEALLYFSYLSLIITALVPMTLHVSNCKNLPVAFKSATSVLGVYLMPIAYAVTLLLFFIPSIHLSAPLLRFVCSIFFLAYALAYWIRGHMQSHTILLRFAAQSVIVSLAFDLLGFSLVSTDSRPDITSALICAIIWLLTFTTQIVLSLFAPKKTTKSRDSEYAVSIISIISILFTPALCHGFTTAAMAAVWLVICLIVAILGIIHAIHYKNVTWSIATAVSVMIVPGIIGGYIASPAWDGGAYLAAYSIISILFLLGTYFLRKIQKHEANMLGIACVIASCFAIIVSAADIKVGYVGFLITTCILTLFAFITEIPCFYETAVYTFAISLFLITDTVVDNATFSGAGSRYALANTLKGAIDAHILGGAMVGAHILSKYLYKTKSPARYIVGYIAFSLIMTIVCLEDYSANSGILWPLLFLIEQVGALLYSVFRKINWMIWFSSIEILLIAFELTGGMSYLWLGIIGIGLIAVVIWQLKKANDKQAKIDNSTKKE